MIQGVQDIYYNVKDVSLALDFYTSALGMTCKNCDQWWAALDCAGVTIGLHWTQGNEVPSIPRDAHGAYAGATLTLKSTDISADRKKLEQYGAKILGESLELWGHMLIFEDIDGNVLKLMHPK